MSKGADAEMSGRAGLKQYWMGDSLMYSEYAVVGCGWCVCEEIQVP